MNKFPGKRPGERCLLVIYKSRRFWFKKALEWWLIVTIFISLLWLFSLFIIANTDLLIGLWFLFIMVWSGYIIFKFIQKREKNSLIVTSERLLKTGKNIEASLTLTEIVDVVVNDKNHWLGGSLVFNGGSKVDMGHVNNAKDIAHYIQKIANLKMQGTSALLPEFKGRKGGKY